MKRDTTYFRYGNDCSCGRDRWPDSPVPMVYFFKKASPLFDALRGTHPRRIREELIEPPMPTSTAARETGIAKMLQQRPVRGIL